MDSNAFLGIESDLIWQMSHTDRLAVLRILEKTQPRLSLEIGTSGGGSLQVIARHSKQVISIDIHSEVAQRLAGRFGNVAFMTGDSRELLPVLVKKFNENGETPGFVLIDGGHSADCVKSDVENLLLLEPRGEVVILLHDSFNPGCRRGMLAAQWERSPHVHLVEIDFTPGGFYETDEGPVPAGSMWGGMACAIMKPVPRAGKLSVQQTRKQVFEAIKRISIYAKEEAESNRAAPAFPVRFYRRARIAAGRWRRRVFNAKPQRA